MKEMRVGAGAGSDRRVLLLMAGVTFFWFAMEMAFARLHAYAIVQVVWLRYLVHLAAMLAVLGPRRLRRCAATRRGMLHAARGALMITMPLLGAAAIARLHRAELMTAFWLLPLVVLVIVRGVRGGAGPRIPFRRWAAAGVSYLGVLALFRPGPALFRGETLLALGAGASFSLYVVLTHRLQQSESIPTNLLYTALAVVAPLTPLVPFCWQTPSPGDALLMALIGLLGLPTLWCLEKALELRPPAELAPLLFLFPLWGAIARPLAAGALPGPAAAAGAALIVAGIAAHYLPPR